MLSRCFRRAGVGVLCCVLLAPSARAQTTPPSGLPGPWPTAPGYCPAPRMPGLPPSPGMPPPDGSTTRPPDMGGTMPAQDTAPSFAGAPGPATGGAYNTASLYVDSAIPRSEFRVRYDSMWDNNRPDRGEFFYPKCGCLRFPSAGANFDPSARGPILPETNITNTQEVRSYLEYAFSNRLSTFVEVPIRIINPEQNDNTSGLGDIDAGFKYAFVYNENTVLTFQFRTYTPTGDGDKGLGTEHVSLEPALLLYQRLGERANFEAELRDWIATGGSDFA
ncbi:MAG TPA: hypothetical protein VKD72_17255, partial [Gemmataceae bacterium]|nr:hypothetical protein [Gemmataceae bacterium]